MSSLASKAHFGNYSPGSFGWNSRDPMDDPSLLVDFSHSGAHFGSMHRDVVGIFTALLDELVPLIPGGIGSEPPDDGCYNPSSVTEGGTRSFHTWAIAIDVNWRANPMGAGHQTGKGSMPVEVLAIARKYGCESGGAWSSPKDWMHIECHLAPADARAFQPEGLDMDAKEVHAIVRDELDDFVKRLTGLDGEVVAKMKHGHALRTVIADELHQATPGIAKAVVAALPHATATPLPKATK